MPALIFQPSPAAAGDTAPAQEPEPFARPVTDPAHEETPPRRVYLAGLMQFLSGYSRPTLAASEMER